MDTMLKIFWKGLQLSPAALGISLLVGHSSLAQQAPTAASTANETSTTLEAVSQYTQDFSTESESADPMNQVTNVSQFSDVRAGDWAYEALRQLVERYGCIAGYPDGTFRGNRSLSRYEFAAGLNACLRQVERLIASATTSAATREDLETIRRLTQEFQAELATLGTRVDKLEGRVSFLENHQFSTTTKLNAEVIIALSDVFGDRVAVPSGESTTELNVNTILSDRVRLNFDTSFTGKDLLRTRLQARNTTPFSSALTGTNMTRFGFDGNEENQVYIHRLQYTFPLTAQTKVNVLAVGAEYNDMIYNFNPLLSDAGSGSISRFGRFSPIYRQSGEGTGISIDHNFGKSLNLAVGYTVPRGSFTSTNIAADPGLSRGLFNGAYAALAQLNFKPSDAFNLGFTYVRSYNNPESGVNVSGSTGSVWANQPFVTNTGSAIATSADHFGLEGTFKLSPRFVISGWGGYSKAYAANNLAFANGIQKGDEADIWNWAVTLGLPDFGKKGNLLGFVFGMPPKVTGNDFAARVNRDTSYHIEGFYRYQLTNNIAITPGLFVILNPEHNNANDALWVATIRTTFKF